MTSTAILSLTKRQRPQECVINVASNSPSPLLVLVPFSSFAVSCCHTVPVCFVQARKQFATNGFVVADFGVSLMLNFLKRKQLSRLNEEHQRMVAPMLDLLANCFEQSRSDDLTAKVRACAGGRDRALSWSVDLRQFSTLF